MPESPRYRRGSRLLRHSLHSSRNRFLSSRLESVSCRQLWKDLEAAQNAVAQLEAAVQEKQSAVEAAQPPVTKQRRKSKTES